ncbi:MAG TPA: putative zinc-binding peptidase [Chryseolinea sp.]|nr:putative zinc-binding peptidase [Chryseolinea sp.]
MKLYTCSKCQNLLYFENTSCLRCGHVLGFDADTLELTTLAEDNTSGIFYDIRNKQKRYRFCSNQQYGTCNWLVPDNGRVPENDDEGLCRACILNRTIPPLTDENLSLWRKIEIAKHRLIYSLLRLNLPVHPKVDDDGPGLAFDFLTELSPAGKIMTGHDAGLITLNIAEADEAQRVRNKQDLGEKYRTLLGHFRHEIGHYYWDRRLRDSPDLKAFRRIFGDESQSYEDALKTYYDQGAPANWMDNYISPYASSHPWEDWAESWSHYLHMLDTVETAYYFGISVDPKKSADIHASIDRDPYFIKDFETVFNMWLPITFAVNSLNRSMGHPDFYPFVIAPPVIEKMTFIHNLRKTIK